MPTDLSGLPGDTHVAPTADQLYDDLGMMMLAAADKAIVERGVFHVALSGGSTPEPFYVRLVIDPRYRGIPWDKTHVWIVDERRVPEDHEKNNYRMIRSSLVDHIPIKKRQLHPMPVLDADPAGVYEAEMRKVFAPASKPGEYQPMPRLDFVLLGMGDDAHTASLFPGSDAINENKRWIVTNDGPKVTPPPRLTMTYPLLNAARLLTVLCVGAKKTATLKRVADQVSGKGPDPKSMPITGIDPTDGDFIWFLDAAAAGG